MLLCGKARHLRALSWRSDLLERTFCGYRQHDKPTGSMNLAEKFKFRPGQFSCSSVAKLVISGLSRTESRVAVQTPASPCCVRLRCKRPRVRASHHATAARGPIFHKPTRTSSSLAGRAAHNAAAARGRLLHHRRGLRHSSRRISNPAARPATQPG